MQSPSSHFPRGGGSGCGPQPYQAGDLVLCTCLYPPRAHSVSRLNLLPGRTHLFCILSVFSISNYLCHFFSLCGEAVVTIMNAVLLRLLEIALMVVRQLVAMKIHGRVGASESDTGFRASLSAVCFLVSLSLLPLHISHAFPRPVSLGHSVTRFPSLVKLFRLPVPVYPHPFPLNSHRRFSWDVIFKDLILLVACYKRGN